MSLSRQERQRLQDDKFGPVTLHWRLMSMWGLPPSQPIRQRKRLPLTQTP